MEAAATSQPIKSPTRPSVAAESKPGVQTPANLRLHLYALEEGKLYSAPLTQCVPSKTNPRKQFEGPEFDELVESVLRHGVIVPLIVRRGDWQDLKAGIASLEIVAGERRFRAAQRAGLLSVPVVFRKLTDEQAIELQIIENLQRQDVTALEEAEGYTKLLAVMSEGAKDYPRQKMVDDLARKVGKSIRYIYARMKLTELAPAAKEAIKTGRLDVSHGDELARLPQARQTEIVGEVLKAPGAAPSVRDFKKAIKTTAPKPFARVLSDREQQSEACRLLGRKMRQDIDLRGEIVEDLQKVKFDLGSPFADNVAAYSRGLSLDLQVMHGALRKAAGPATPAPAKKAIFSPAKKRAISAKLKAAVVKRAAKKAGRK